MATFYIIFRRYDYIGKRSYLNINLEVFFKCLYISSILPEPRAGPVGKPSVGIKSGGQLESCYTNLYK